MRTTQRKGDIATAHAISTFTKMGYDVSIPLTESAAYDIVVDTGKVLKRVQVKFTSSGEVDLRRIHSNSKGYVVKKTKVNVYDWLYILTNDNKEYIVRKCLHERRSIKPAEQYRIRNVSQQNEMETNM